MKTNRTHSLIKSAVCEAVESRRLMAATAWMDGITLRIEGTSEADTISVSKSGSDLKVKLNANTTKTFQYSKVSFIKAFLYAKGDKFTSYNDVIIPMEVHGGDNYDTITTGGGSDKLYGDANWDQLNGGDSVDFFYGGTGNDTCHGGNGIDIFNDDTGKDEYYGEADNDQFFADKYNYNESDLFDGGAGAGDMISYFYNRNDPVTITMDGVANDGFFGYGTSKSVESDNVKPTIERVYGTKKSDTIIGFGYVNFEFNGNEGNDLLIGGEGNDSLWGNIGNDSLDGRGGYDSLSGQQGRDTLQGGDGHDTLVGGLDIDFLYGGAHNDVLYADNNDFGEIVDGGGGFDRADVDILGITPIDLLVDVELLI